MKNTSDALRVTFDASHTDESVIYVARAVNGKIDVLKMELGEQAELLYHLLTEKTAKVEIAESKEQDVVSRQEVLKYFEGWKNQIKYYHPYAKNFDIPYEEAIQRIKDVPPVKCVSSENPNKCEDVISRQAVLDATVKKNSIWNSITNSKGENLEEIISQLPPINSQKPKTGHCKDCKYFEYNSVAKVDGIPLIVAHEICSRWGDGCKTSENGYCFLFESKAESEEAV